MLCHFQVLGLELPFVSMNFAIICGSPNVVFFLSGLFMVMPLIEIDVLVLRWCFELVRWLFLILFKVNHSDSLC